MRTTKENIVNEYMHKNNLIFYFVVQKDGKVTDYNEFASLFVKNGNPIESIKEVFIDFFERMNIRQLTENPDLEHLFSINSHKGIPEAFYFSFYEINGEYLILGRMDVMEIEEFQSKLIALNNELSNLSRELHKSNAELKKMNDMKNRFLGMAAHDLRKPITVIKGYTSLLLNGAAGELGKRQSEFITAIESSSVHMEALVNDFLDVSVIESGTLELVYSDISLEKEIEEMLHLNRIKAENRKIKLHINISPDTGVISADKMKLQQVLDNIVGNAVEFTPASGNVILNVFTEANNVVFEVLDEGPGIPENKMDSLFKYFGKTGAVKASGDKSTGLGLIICKKIIEQHGGRIMAENIIPKGAKFTFILPKKRGDGK
ncbi:MAG: HAMP domain-containing histidine kinase [Candidatus Goldbacteria bacterium]|nr:HAMP domain-containing histidine kinase [Candidatus Goldiibacteriota bacterium]